MAQWTKDRIADLSSDQIKSLRENAAKYGRPEIVDLCDEELLRQRPPRLRKGSDGPNEDHRGHYVSEFHFVCPTELGISRNPDGTIWTGTWVVAKEHAEKAVKYRALVSLHLSKAELSYLQGTIKDWRRSPRQPRYSGDQRTQITEGIDFLVEPSDTPTPWKGDAAGEKGYEWKPLSE
jgi:hypothetical protein